MTEAGWFADPTGRFGQRWYDGSAWTSSVVGASGAVIDDALPETDTPLAPPNDNGRRAADAAPSQPTVAAQPGDGQALGYPVLGYGASGYAPTGYGPTGYGPAGYGPPAAGPATRSPYGPPGAPAPGQVRYGTGAGLGIGLLGLLLVALSLFALNWTKADKSQFTTLSSNLRKVDSSRIPSAGLYAYYLYGAWLAFVLFAAVAVLVLLAGIPLPKTPGGNRYWRVAAAVLAASGAVLHSMTVAYLFKGTATDVGAGPLLGILGWLIVVVAMIFGARRIVGVPLRPY